LDICDGFFSIPPPGVSATDGPEEALRGKLGVLNSVTDGDAKNNVTVVNFLSGQYVGWINGNHGSQGADVAMTALTFMRDAVNNPSAPNRAKPPENGLIPFDPLPAQQYQPTPAPQHQPTPAQQHQPTPARQHQPTQPTPQTPIQTN